MRYMFTAIVVALCVTASPSSSSAQSDEALIKETINTFFEAMTARDSTTSHSLIVADGQFVSVREGNGKTIPRTQTFADYLASLSVAGPVYLERTWNESVTITGSIAVVTAPYDFHLDGKFSHCGTDIVTLIKTDRWKISGFVYTVETENCEPSPLGHPKK